MHGPETNHDAPTLALLALAWSLEDSRRAERLLALTGLTTNDLRARATDPALQAAVLSFLEAHELDLVACADHLGVKPELLIRARTELDA
ncbi:DUF3572 family protein [Sphingomonas sp. MAH-20]|uniref:DUF3572 family protein n=1 Tax=Sphingomonas horti TaxID=2682842 RepID=A0A6I4IZZ3_9SPHN|nr:MULTISPECIES: DUF3572 family protein [Sphingomonas]MBA2920810.1 DUF3572 family protein [Sphingomonas sp. CGMCC 1.13658]MVO77745.1 DUF3572 family protein [Sphingomonas horti]